MCSVNLKSHKYYLLGFLLLISASQFFFNLYGVAEFFFNFMYVLLLSIFIVVNKVQS